MRRAAWPTMMLTVIALLAVLAVLLSTGGNHASATKFIISATPSSQAVVIGGAVQYRIQVISNDGFHGAVDLSTTDLPPGVTASFDVARVVLTKAAPTATLVLTVRTSQTGTPGPIGMAVVGRSGPSTATGSLSLRIDPSGITDVGPPPQTITSPGGITFTISGGATGILAPGVSMPLTLQLQNPNSVSLVVRQISVDVAGTSNPSCSPANFVITQYRGRYPLTVPPGKSRTLTQLGVPEANWPRIGMLNLPTNQDVCKGVTVRLRYSGTGDGS